MFASQSVAVDGYDVRDLILALVPGTTLTGTVVFEANPSGADSLARVRVATNPLQNLPFLGSPEARVDDDGSFVLENVPGGPRLLGARGVPDGLMLKAVYLEGQDVIDTPLEFAGVSRVDGIRLVVTDQVSQISGVVSDRQGSPRTDYTVIAFPSDENLWQPLSRRVKAAHPDQNAHYELEALPAGEYLLAAVDAVQEGQWFDPQFLSYIRAGSLRVSLAEGESKDVDLGLDLPPR